MSLKVAAFPECCGAKIIYGFPSGQLIEDEDDFREKYGSQNLAYYLQYNENLANILRKDIQALFDKPYSVHRVDSIENYPFWVEKDNRIGTNSHPIDKNAFVLAITNKPQDHLCGPVLKEFGFVLIKEKLNPNSGNTVYLYLLTPNW
jgi:hypothetical protein